MIRLTITTFNHINIYIRNVDACIKNQKMNRSCTERIRFNTPTIHRLDEVKLADLGDLFMILSGSIRFLFKTQGTRIFNQFSSVVRNLNEVFKINFRQISVLIGQLSNSLVADKNLEQGSQEYNDTKNLIQVAFSQVLTLIEIKFYVSFRIQWMQCDIWLLHLHVFPDSLFDYPMEAFLLEGRGLNNTHLNINCTPLGNWGFTKSLIFLPSDMQFTGALLITYFSCEIKKQNNILYRYMFY